MAPVEGQQVVERPRILVIVPAYNEEASIGALLGRLRQVCVADWILDTLVVDDGSIDSTVDVARSHGVAVAPMPIHLGIGAALRTGFRHAVDGDYGGAIQLDADGQHDPEEIPRILAGLDKGADLVIGTRFGDDTEEASPRYRPSAPRALAMRWLRLGVRLHTGARHSDPSSGFRGFSPAMCESFAREYPLDYLESVEALISAHLLGFDVAEVPITGRARVAGVPSHRGHRLGFHYLRMWMALMLLRRRRA